MFNANWRLVDEFTVDQAAALWCDSEPVEGKLAYYLEGKVDLGILAIRQMLFGAIAAGTLEALHKNNPTASIGDYSSSIVHRRSLYNFAKLKKQRPAFLFDTIFALPDQPVSHEEVEPPKQSAIKEEAAKEGGRPPEYDWDAMYIEIVRYADMEGLPKVQAKLIDHLLSWFGENPPSESNVKPKVSKIYNALISSGWSSREG